MLVTLEHIADLLDDVGKRFYAGKMHVGEVKNLQILVLCQAEYLYLKASWLAR